MISSVDLALVIATCRSRRSSSINPAAAAAEISACEVKPVRIDSTSRSLPSNEPRSLRLGHAPSCNPATTTNSHSNPLAAWTVRSETTSSRAALEVMLSERIRSFRSWSIKLCGVAPWLRSTNRRADSKRMMIASRSRSACAPLLPPASARSCQR